MGITTFLPSYLLIGWQDNCEIVVLVCVVECDLKMCYVLLGCGIFVK